MKKSMIDLAYDILSNENKAMTFLSLWEIVSREMGYNQQQHDDNIAQFYSDLSIDGRFASLPGNSWDLRKRQNVANTIVDTDLLSVDDEDEEEFVSEEDGEEMLSDSDDDEDSDTDEDE